MKPSKFIELFWKWVSTKFTGRIVIEFNEGGIRDAYHSIEKRLRLK